MLNQTNCTAEGRTVILLLVLINILIIKVAFIHNEKWYLALFVTLPLLVVAIYNARQKRQAIPGAVPGELLK